MGKKSKKKNSSNGFSSGFDDVFVEPIEVTLAREKKAEQAEFEQKAKELLKKSRFLENGVGEPQKQTERGLICPHCGSKNSKVYSVNTIEYLNLAKRYRKCDDCELNFVSTVLFDK